ncbi:N-acetyltransferase family protein [Leucobacter sp. GX0328]
MHAEASQQSTAAGARAVVPREAEVGTASAAALAAFAARTFPDACPEWMPAEHVLAFIAEGLSERQFAAWLADPDSHVLVAEGPDRALVGYAVCLHGLHDENPEQWAGQRTAYLSKLYVDPESRGAGVARSLFDLALETARADGCAAFWLGVNDENARARAFYLKAGLAVSGRRRFRVGDTLCTDDVLGRELLGA